MVKTTKHTGANIRLLPFKLFAFSDTSTPFRVMNPLRGLGIAYIGHQTLRSTPMDE
jgi:hypothetical protein